MYSWKVLCYLLDPNFITKKHLKCYKNKNKPRKKLFKI